MKGCCSEAAVRLTLVQTAAVSYALSLRAVYRQCMQAQAGGIGGRAWLELRPLFLRVIKGLPAPSLVVCCCCSGQRCLVGTGPAVLHTVACLVSHFCVSW